MDKIKITLIVLTILIISGGGIYFYLSSQSQPVPVKPVQIADQNAGNSDETEKDPFANLKKSGKLDYEGAIIINANSAEDIFNGDREEIEEKYLNKTIKLLNAEMWRVEQIDLSRVRVWTDKCILDFDPSYKEILMSLKVKDKENDVPGDKINIYAFSDHFDDSTSALVLTNCEFVND